MPMRILPKPVCLNKEEYGRFLRYYPHAEKILKTPLVDEDGIESDLLVQRGNKVYIYIDVLPKDRQLMLGVAALRELKFYRPPSIQKKFLLWRLPSLSLLLDKLYKFTTVIPIIKAKKVPQPIPNPFVYGQPIYPHDEVFVGRKDVVKLIQQSIQEQKPTLFLYGRRRTGKTSALLNLNRFLGSWILAVYIDAQDLRFRESSFAFCHNVTKAISEFSPQLHEIWILQDFEKNPFTAFNNFLDEAEQFVSKQNKLILLAFDEYERLEAKQKEILDTLRAIIQHRRKIIVLVAGSHRFEEIKDVRWSDYLINTQTVEISYLDRESAYKLITNPVEGFDLRYPPDMPETILELTHCQPYLLQAVASLLVDHLNLQKRKEAVFEDLELVKEKVLTAAEAYFVNVWQDECSEDERQFLEELLLNKQTAFRFDPHNRVVRSLLRKEIVDRQNGAVQIAVPLFQEWIQKKQLMLT